MSAELILTPDNFPNLITIKDLLQSIQMLPVLRNGDLQESLAAGTFAVVERTILNPNARPFSIGQVAASYVAETALKYFRRSVFCRPMKDCKH
jgi:hypothetical protein